MAEHRKLKLRVVIRAPAGMLATAADVPEREESAGGSLGNGGDSTPTSRRLFITGLVLAVMVVGGAAVRSFWPEEPEGIETVGASTYRFPSAPISRDVVPASRNPSDALATEVASTVTTASNASPEATVTGVDPPDQAKPTQPQLPGPGVVLQARNGSGSELLGGAPEVEAATAAHAPGPSPGAGKEPALSVPSTLASPAPTEASVPVEAIATGHSSSRDGTTAGISAGMPGATPEQSSDAAEIGVDEAAAGATPTVTEDQHEPVAEVELASLVEVPDSGSTETEEGLEEILSDHLTRAQLSWGVHRREPTIAAGGTVTVPGPGSSKIYFFTEVIGFGGRTIQHRWVYEGRTAATVRFQIGGDRWRVHSTKNLSPRRPGDWEVIVEDADGEMLGRRRFRVESERPAG